MTFFIRGILVLVGLLALAGPVWAQAGGPFVRPGCTSLTNPVAHATACFDTTTGVGTWKVWDGVHWVADLPRQSGIVNVKDYGALGDGATNDAPSFQAAIDAAQSLGGMLMIPPAPVRYLLTSGLTVSATASAFPLTMMGSGKYTTVLRYSGTGTWLGPTGGTTNIQIHLRDFTVQLSGAGGTGIDMSRFASSTIRGVRIASGAGVVNGIGISARPTDNNWAPFLNILDDVTFDSLTTGLLLDTTVGNAPNRWRIIAPTFVGGIDSVKLGTNSTQLVAGTDFVVPAFDEITGVGITLGANADRTTILGARMESSVGGTLYSIAAANRTVILGTTVHAGTPGTTSLGTRGFLTGQWDEGVAWSGETSTTPQRIVRDSDSGIYIDFGATTFLNLGTPSNGRVLYCSDCTIASPCTSGGTGALAKRLAGAWVCN